MDVLAEARVKRLRDYITIQGKSFIELGAQVRPTLQKTEADIDYLDYATREEIVSTIIDDPSLQQNVPETDVLVTSDDYALFTDKKYDCCIANHVIEHVNDICYWLNSVDKLLKPNGILFLSIPDKKRSFDKYKADTNFAHIVLDTFLDDSDRVRYHAIESELLYDHTYAGKQLDILGTLDKKRLEKAYNQKFTPNNHRHIFQAETFENKVMAPLCYAGFANFKIISCDSICNQFGEFYCILKKGKQTSINVPAYLHQGTPAQRNKIKSNPAACVKEPSATQATQASMNWRTDQAIALLTEVSNSRSYRLGKIGRYLVNAIKTRRPSVLLGFTHRAFQFVAGNVPDMKPYAQTDLVKEAILLLSNSSGYGLQQCESRNIMLIPETMEKDEFKKLVDTIQKAKRSGRKAICIMAPIFNEERLRDGYYRRIQAIDTILGERTLKIYMSPMDYDYKKSMPMISYIDETHINIAYDFEDYVQRQITMQIAQEAGTAYHHSVGYANPYITTNPFICKVFDLHGALPEEHIMREDFWNAQIDGEKEELAMQHANAIVCVTDSMRQHMTQKYPDVLQKYIILPILDQCIISKQAKTLTRDYPNGMPVITYAGGTQKWQMVDAMQDAISKMRDHCEFRIFVPSPDAFWVTWGKREKPKNMCVQSKSLEELQNEYAQCHYGFVLREDCVVNNVACPTKLVEYLLQGIVPIMLTTRLGDFVADGMQYISLEQFCANELPQEDERLRIARENQQVVSKLINKYELGKRQLQDLLGVEIDE